MKRHIETVGLPGSGKSTYSSLIQALLRDAGIPTFRSSEIPGMSIQRSANDRRQRLLFSALARTGIHPRKEDPRRLRLSINAFIAFVATHSEWFHFALGRLIEREFDREERHYFLSYLFELCSRYQMAREGLTDQECLILDEGFSYLPVRSLGLGRRVLEGNIGPYLDLIPKPDIVIHIRCHPELCDHRMSLRSAGYPGMTEKWTLEKRLEFWRLQSEQIDFVVSGIAERGVTVISVDSTGTIEDVEELLSHELGLSLNAPLGSASPSEGA